MYVEYSLQNRFVFLISLFGLSAILKIRNGEHAHYVGLVVVHLEPRKTNVVALGKEFDMGGLFPGNSCTGSIFYKVKSFFFVIKYLFATKWQYTNI